MDDDTFRVQLLKRLDVIIRLLLEPPQAGDPLRLSDIVGRLDEMGLSTGDISSIVGKPSNHVSASLRSYKAMKGKAKR